MTQGQRNAKYVQDHQSQLRNHLIPFFGNLGGSEVTAGKAQDYRFERLKVGNERQPPSRSTMHHEIVRHRRVLKAAVRQGWLDHPTDLSISCRASGKVMHRAWFSPSPHTPPAAMLPNLVLIFFTSWSRTAR